MVKKKLILICCMILFLQLCSLRAVLAAPDGIMWNENFGGIYPEKYIDVTETADGGCIAVGYSFEESFGNGNWEGVAGQGNGDAIIAKYDGTGNIVWKKNFGGESSEDFTAVATTADGGYIAVGQADTDSFGSGNWVGVTGQGYGDAIIVKYDESGNVQWRKSFGGTNFDLYNDVYATNDGGCIVVGNSSELSFGSGDLNGLEGKGEEDAIIVKYDASGNVVWKNNFGGAKADYYYAVTEAADGGYIAAGNADMGSFGNGDWAGHVGKGNTDAIIVKYDDSGNVIWKSTFGGIGDDYFSGAATTTNGYVSVGHSSGESFGNGDWAGVTGKGEYDAIIVKYGGEAAKGIICGNVYLQGMNDHSGIQVTITGFAPVLTSTLGVFQIEVPPGAYNILEASMEKFLPAIWKSPLEVEDGETITLPSVTLLSGDIFDSGSTIITIQDISELIENYGTTDFTYDLNMDGFVDLFDLVLLSKNFGQAESTWDG